VNGELYNYVLNATSIPPVYRVFEINSTGTGRILATIEDAPPAYIHSTFSTDNYVILIVWQADFGPTPKPTYNILDSLKPWNPDRDVLFCKSSRTLEESYK
jgi:torulene dioxygenase